MRILHVSPYSIDAWGYGGIPRAISSLCVGQHALGHQLTLCATDARDGDGRLPLPEGGQGGAVDVHLFANLSNRLAWKLQAFAPRGMSSWLARAVPEHDVVHVHGCRHLPGVLALRAAAAARVPVVLSPHGTAVNIERRQGLKRAFDWTLGRTALSQPARVLAVSNAEATALQRLGVAPERVQVVGNALDLAEFDVLGDPAALRRTLVGDGQKLVVFLGRVTPRKCADVLVQAFAHLPPSTRLVISGHDGGGLDAARAACLEWGVGGRVNFSGPVAGSARLTLLAAADAVAYPAHDEVFGLVAIEALLVGTPVVVGDDSGCGEWVHALGGGLAVQPGDPLALAAALAEVLGPGKPFKAAAHRAAQLAAARFHPSAVAAQVLDAYTAARAEVRA